MRSPSNFEWAGGGAGKKICWLVLKRFLQNSKMLVFVLPSIQMFFFERSSKPE